MADGVFGVEVVTPEQSLFAGGARSVVLATSDGALTVLDGHTPLVGDVVPCELKLEQTEGPLLRFAVHGGFLQVDTSPGAAEGLAEGDGPAGGPLDAGDHAGRHRRAGRRDRRGACRAGAGRGDAAGQRPARRRGTGGGASAVGAGGEEIEVDVELVEAQGSLDRAELRLAVAAGEA